MKFYWYGFPRDGGFPVRFPEFQSENRTYRWTGLYGIQIGPWFIGAIKGKVDTSEGEEG